MKKIMIALRIILTASFILSVWSQMMFDQILGDGFNVMPQLNEAMKYKEFLLYPMIIGASTFPFIVYFLFDNYRWAKYLAALSILPVFLVFSFLWHIFCCYA